MAGKLDHQAICAFRTQHAASKLYCTTFRRVQAKINIGSALLHEQRRCKPCLVLHDVSGERGAAAGGHEAAAVQCRRKAQLGAGAPDPYEAPWACNCKACQLPFKAFQAWIRPELWSQGWAHQDPGQCSKYSFLLKDHLVRCALCLFTSHSADYGGVSLQETMVGSISTEYSTANKIFFFRRVKEGNTLLVLNIKCKKSAVTFQVSLSDSGILYWGVCNSHHQLICLFGNSIRAQ